ncbi:thioredoxin domain-containing protein 11-like [Dreissena polymorpha]|uniref:Thioredoxin domain-containing protein n=1 Tax=Dreissena polymorpha TaxID=45954 RepID=A0A9D4LQL8_DREPO|nr:thioredoxin domain-containing protein 11-like [Dreissena polymorpha]KAH3861933.1 hypothetical protein DPMN_024887 [Dreissena polymorpha]
MERISGGPRTSTSVSSGRVQRIIRILHRLSRIMLVLILALMFLIYTQDGESFHQKQITREAAPPRHFFPPHCKVADFPYGELAPVVKLLEDEEFIFVMYYAPWCAESIKVREEFIQAAKVLSSTVKFVAINCWHHKGECRQRMKFFSFPELFVYHTGVMDGYRFTGQKQAEYLVKFVESFLYPLKPLYSVVELDEFSVQGDNTVIGYFDFNSSPQPPGQDYYQFYLAALRVIALDFYQPVNFGVVVTKKLAAYVDIETPGRLIFGRLGNITLKYPPAFNMTARNISNWILHHKQKSQSPWLVPPGVKSLTLSVPMQQGATVFLFGPTNSLLNVNPYYDMVRFASLAYQTCGNKTNVYNKAMRLYLHNSISRMETAKQFHKKCLKMKSPNYYSNFPSLTSRCCVSLLSKQKTSEHKSYCEYCVHQPLGSRDTVCDLDLESNVKPDWSSNLLNSCSDFYQFYNVNKHNSVCCQESTAFSLIPKSTNRYRRNTDPYVVNGETTFMKQYHNKLTLQKSKSLLPLNDLIESATNPKDLNSRQFTGLQCRTNKTVSFYYVDSVYNSAFLERLGIQSTHSSHSAPSVILVDLDDEAVFTLNKDVTYQNLVRFVVNYTSGLLVRSRQSSDGTSPSECGSGTQRSVCLHEVTASTFHTDVLNNTQDVVLLFYTPWCGFCRQVAQSLLTIASYFRNSNILFARVNADQNDLPWEFTVDRFPTVIFLPAHRKFDSVVFPEKKPKSIPNLLKFILHYANFSLQFDTAVGMCTEQCIQTNRKKVLLRIGELERSIQRLQRRGMALAQVLPSNQQQQAYLNYARSVVIQSRDSKRLKLRKSQLLNGYLQKNWKHIDKKMMLKYLEESNL